MIPQVPGSRFLVCHYYVRPFKGSFDKVTAEGFDPGKFNPKIPKEDRHELTGSALPKKHDEKLSNEEKASLLHQKRELSEYLETIRQNEKIEKEKPGSSKIDPISLKEYKAGARRAIKDIENRLIGGGFEYTQKEMIKKQQQRISKSIERAVKELRTLDKAAFTHFLEALRPINSLDITYKTSKNIKWETK